MNVYNIHFITFFSLIAILLAMYWTQRKQAVGEEELLGLGKGTVKLLGQWIGIPCFLASTQASYEYGIVGLLGYCATGIISFLLIYLVNRKRGTRRQPVRILPLLSLLEGILISVLAGKMILHLIYTWNDLWSVTAVTLFLLLMLLVQIGKRTQASFVIVILSMSATMLLPTLVYLKISVPTVYSGVKFLATDTLRLDSLPSWWLAAALFIRFTACSLINPRLETIYHQIKKSKRGLCFSLTPFIWAFLPISMGTLSFVAKAEAVWPQLPDEVSLLVVGYFSGQIGIVLLIVTLVVILVTAIPRETYGDDSWPKRAGWLRGAVIFLAGVVALWFPNLTILETMLYFALIWAAVAPAVMLSNALGRIGATAVIGAGLAAGFLYTQTRGIIFGVVADVAVSMSVAVMFAILMVWKKRGNRLEPSAGSEKSFDSI